MALSEAGTYQGMEIQILHNSLVECVLQSCCSQNHFMYGHWSQLKEAEGRIQEDSNQVPQCPLRISFVAFYELPNQCLPICLNFKLITYLPSFSLGGRRYNKMFSKIYNFVPDWFRVMTLSVGNRWLTCQIVSFMQFSIVTVKTSVQQFASMMRTKELDRKLHTYKGTWMYFLTYIPKGRWTFLVYFWKRSILPNTM